MVKMTPETPIVTALRPARELRPYVAGYWFVHDPAGVYAHELIKTFPIESCVLAVNFAEPNRFDDRFDVPTVGLLGLHGSTVTYRASSHTKFVMAVLTLQGCIAILDGAAAAAVGTLAELDTLLSPSAADNLRSATYAARTREDVALAFDCWIGNRITASAVDRARRLGGAVHRLKTGTVGHVARELGLSRRQLHRLFVNDLGVGPKAIASLHRFSNSVSGVVDADLDPVTGYADQAHQIRDWRARAGVSPGRYAALGPSDLARQFSSVSPEAPRFYA